MHNGHACDGLCLNKNFVNGIRLLGISWELAVPTVCMVNYLYHVPHSCKMINYLQISVAILCPPCFHKKETSGPEKVY